MGRFLVALVGRPNVGKSRLFNRLSTTTKAIVHDFEGVTRDRQYARGEWYNKRFTVIDTGGFVPSSDEPMLMQMRRQAQLAIEEADAIIFMMDGRMGFATGDQEIAQMLRMTDKPVFHVINKIDGPSQKDTMLADFYHMGVQLYPLSAEHGPGLDDLMDDIALHIPADAEHEEELPFARVAFVGKPNAGKSSLINALLGEDRLLTSDVPGTTRDSVDTMLTAKDGKEYMLIDTAGLRRKRSISEDLEQFSVVQAIRSLDRADVAILVLDATLGLSMQEKKIASVIAGRGCACVIVVNKWDLMEKDSFTADTIRKELAEEMPYMNWAPVIFTSALTRQRVFKILESVDQVFENYTKRVTTSSFNKFLEKALLMHSPPVTQNRRIKFYYGSQVATRPPAFVYMVNYPDNVPDSYKRFLENRLREEFDFDGTPIRTMLRARRRRAGREDED